MNAFQWMIAPLKKYASFSGRARRKEYWMFFLLVMIVQAVVSTIVSAAAIAALVPLIESLTYSSDPTNAIIAIIGAMASSFAIPGLIMLAVLLPSLGVAVRRLHDIGKSGGWIFIYLVPFFIGPIWFIVLMATAGTVGPNQYGPDPKAEENGYVAPGYQQPQ